MLPCLLLIHYQRGYQQKGSATLYEKIWNFCPDNSNNKTCPMPSVAKPSSSAHHKPKAPSLGGTSMGVPPAPKRRRKQQ
uniref:Uncharacterized protein n=1 Tax=Amphimedon queenslandica TaxID=400682 RepID=A0A1X7TK47_AMPQE